MLMKCFFRCLCIIVCLFFIPHFIGCGDDVHDDAISTQTGAAEFTLIWPNEEPNQRIDQAKGNPTINCTKKNISTIRVDVYDGSLDKYLTGDSFFCKDGEGTVYSIPSGKNRIFKVSGRNSEGKIVYEGEKGGVEIIADKVIPVGRIEMNRFNNSPPTATIVTSNWDILVFSLGEEIEFTGSGLDPEDGPLKEDALIWTADRIVGPIGTGFSCSVSNLPKGWNEITLTATDDDNATGSSSIIISVSPKENKMPKATIIKPEKDKNYDYGEEIEFYGIGYDPDDNDWSAKDYMRWEAIQDGETVIDLGTGGKFTKSDLLPGTYTISLIASDKDGGMDKASVKITVLENDLPVAKIMLPAAGIYGYGEEINFKGTGEDREDAILDFKWTSDRDGVIGTGSEFTISDLQLGPHVITLTVTDKHGGADTAFITINVVKKFFNTIGMTLSEISPGTFTMGNPEEVGVPDEEDKFNQTQHKVTLTYSFYIQTTEVTQGEWKKIMGADSNPSHFSSCGDDCPVEQVTWYDCVIFCNRLSKKEGLTLSYYSDSTYYTPFDGTPRITSGTVYWKKDANGYRLPTEAEWEYAARAGTKTPFYFGECLSTDQANYNGNYPMDGCPEGEYRETTIQVASLAGSENGWGLFDMYGNVREWCQDWYDVFQPEAVIDPTGPSNGSGRIARGGSYYFVAKSCTSAYRSGPSPAYWSEGYGFRVVRTPNN